MLENGSHTITLDNVTLACHIEGRGPVLLVPSPGRGIGSGYLAAGLKPLSSFLTVVYIDTAGSGSSPRPVDLAQMGTIAIADHLEQLRRHLGLARVSILGHSNSGAIAIAYAQKYPNALAKLVLVDSQILGFSGSEETAAFLAVAAKHPGYASALNHMSDPIPADDTGFSNYVLNLLPLYFHDPEGGVKAFRPVLDKPINAWAWQSQQQADKMAACNQVESLGNIRTETLVLVGKSDWICPPSVSQVIQNGIQGARISVIEAAGHFPWVEQPDKFFALVGEFLS